MIGVLEALALAVPMLAQAQGNPSLSIGKSTTADAFITGTSSNTEIHPSGNFLFTPVRPKLSSAEVRSGSQQSRGKAHALITERLCEERLKLGGIAISREEESPLDKVVVFLDENGAPILPDAEEAKKKSTSSLAVEAVSNELTFTFNSPTYPWSA